MPISGSSILFKYSNVLASGGNSDSGDPTSSDNALTRCRGKYISTAVWLGGAPNDLFENVSGDRNFAQSVDYRCVFVHNSDGGRTLFDAVAWIYNQTAGGVDCAIGVDPTPVSLIGSTSPQAVSIPISTAAPAGVSFYDAASKASGVYLGNIPAGACRAIWIRRSAKNTPPLDADSVTIRVEGDSEE